jgi:hypothetical protein
MDQAWITGMVTFADAAIAVGDPAYVVALFEQLEPWADQMATAPGAASFGTISYYLGGLATVLGRYDAADTSFARSALISDRMEAKFSAARTDLQWGKMLTERNEPGDAARARELLTNAQIAAAANGYANVERRAAEALQDLD